MYSLATAQTEKRTVKSVGLIIGNIVDAATQKPVAFATVKAIQHSTGKIIKTEVADKNGAFECSNLPFGYYKLLIESTGFKTTTIDSIFLRDERYDFNLGDIKISNNNTLLDEVIIYSEKPLIENKDGKITYNVGESALSGGSSTAEILRNMPLISNDPNGKILLKGKEPKILIDDKPTDLTADQLKDLLESLPGNSIDKIELMTNPPPQFATEQGGVINIVTKKGKIGTTGRISISAGTRGEGSLTGNISYRTNKFSTNTVVGVSGNAFNGFGYSYRQNIYKDSTNQFNTNNNWQNNNIRPNFRTQFDYDINKNNHIGLTYQGNLNFFNNNSITQFTNIDRFDNPYRISTRENGSNGNGYTHTITTSYSLKAKNPLEVLRVFLIAGIGKNDNGKDYFQQFLNAGFQPTGIDSTQNQLFNSFNKNYQIRANYDKPLAKLLILSTGAAYSHINYHNTLNTNFFSKQDGDFVNNPLLSNNFYFHQNIFTARASFTVLLPKQFRIIGGVQAEQTSNGFNFVQGNVANTNNNYWNYLPNITFRKDFNKIYNISAIYRASIRRPDLAQLNPNIDYSDPYNIRFGNPFLLPSLSDNFDVNFSFIKGKYNINTSVGFNIVKDIFYPIRTLIDAGKTQITFQNIATRKEYEGSVWGGYTFSKKFRINTSIGYTYNMYSEAEKKLFKYRDGGSFYTTLNYTFNPSNVLTFEGNTRFSSFADPQGRGRSNLNMNIGAQHKFFDRRLIVSFNIIDPFVIQQFTTFTYGANFNIENFSSTNTRNFRLTVAYQLNKMVQKTKLTDKQKQDALKKMQQLKTTPKKSN